LRIKVTQAGNNFACFEFFFRRYTALQVLRGFQRSLEYGIADRALNINANDNFT